MSAIDETILRIESGIQSLQEIYETYSKEANSGHPDSADAVRQQIRITGKIEGMQLALDYAKDEKKYDL